MSVSFSYSRKNSFRQVMLRLRKGSGPRLLREDFVRYSILNTLNKQNSTLVYVELFSTREPDEFKLMLIYSILREYGIGVYGVVGPNEDIDLDYVLKKFLFRVGRGKINENRIRALVLGYIFDEKQNIILSDSVDGLPNPGGETPAE